jgi:hypothetical protein
MPKLDRVMYHYCIICVTDSIPVDVVVRGKASVWVLVSKLAFCEPEYGLTYFILDPVCTIASYAAIKEIVDSDA